MAFSIALGFNDKCQIADRKGFQNIELCSFNLLSKYFWFVADEWLIPTVLQISQETLDFTDLNIIFKISIRISVTNILLLSINVL